MKGWAREAEKQRRSSSATRQFRQLITKLGEGFPNGHYFAYCVCSKQSSHGVFLNQRLIAIDTFNKQIKYYSHVPKLPLASLRELPPSTETLRITQEVEFIIERVRVGHIRISWQEGGQQRLWKFIMASNQVALQLQQLFAQLQQNTFLKNTSQINDVQASFNRAIAKKQSSPLKKSSANGVISKDPSQMIQRTSRFDQQSQRVNISLVRSDKIRQQVTDYFNHHYKLQVSPPPIKKEQKLQAGMAMFNQWILAEDATQRSNIYYKFVQRCKKKVQTFTQNFISSHLLHQQRNGLCMIKDNEVEIYYCPYYTGQQEGYDQLLDCVHKQEEMIAEWETLNYLAKFQRVKDYRISVPMICLITFKSFIFYCKSSCEYYTQRQRIDVYSDFNEQLTILQGQCHLKIRNRKQQIYLLTGLPQKIILISTANCLPILPPKTPIRAKYIELFITSGVISNSKDIQAISNHITGKLTQKIQYNIADHQFSNPCEMMDYILNSGYSHHFLPFILKQAQNQQNTRKIITSALLAKVMEWELRKRMQFQLFKKRQFGFAFNQVRIGINLLLQKDPYFLKVIQGIFRTFYDYYNESLNNLDSLTDVTGFLLTLFNSLGFSCKAHLPYQYQHQIWSQKYINDSLQLDALTSINYMSFDLFSDHQQFFKNKLISPTTFELIGQDKFQQTLICLNIGKEINASYSLSGSYQVMPKDIKDTVNFYLSHFIPPNVVSNKTSLELQIYMPASYYVRRQEYLTTLNRLRWLARMKYYESLERELAVETEKAIVWGDLAYIIQLCSLESKLCKRKGEINRGLQLALRSLQYCLQLYDERPNSLAELLIAQHAFQAANFHYQVHRFTKALDLYKTTEDILSNIRAGDSKTSLNPYFMLIFVNKCSIYLLFGEYQQCISQTASALKSCKKFAENGDSSTVLDYQLKIYATMCKVYLIKNMRRQLLDLGSFCCTRFLEDSINAGEQLQFDRIKQVLKLGWIGVIKGVELVSTALHFGQPIQKQLKTIYLKKIRQQLKNIRHQLNNTYRYQLIDVYNLLTRRVKSLQTKGQSSITSILIKCLSTASLSSKTARSSGIHSKESLTDEWLFLQGLTVLLDYDFLIGTIEDSLHLYDYQY